MITNEVNQLISIFSFGTLRNPILVCGPGLVIFDLHFLDVCKPDLYVHMYIARVVSSTRGAYLYMLTKNISLQ